jgi:hypothetical protein
MSGEAEDYMSPGEHPEKVGFLDTHLIPENFEELSIKEQMVLIIGCVINELVTPEQIWSSLGMSCRSEHERGTIPPEFLGDPRSYAVSMLLEQGVIKVDPEDSEMVQFTDLGWQHFWKMVGHPDRQEKS